MTRVEVVPLTLPTANAMVARLHRHHAPIPGGFGWYCVGAVVDGRLAGAAIAGRPTNRNNDDGQTVEVLRVAADGTANVPSALLGACARAARAIGAARIITYTLESETGSSLLGAGWRREADGITSWWTHPGKGRSGNRVPAVNREHMSESKVRWGLAFRNPLDYEVPEVEPTDPDQLDLLALVDENPRDVLPRNDAAVVLSGDPRVDVVPGDIKTGTEDVAHADVLPVELHHASDKSPQQVSRVGLTPVQIHDRSVVPGADFVVDEHGRRARLA